MWPNHPTAPQKGLARPSAGCYSFRPMSVRIRLTRTGKKNEAYWRIAVFDSRTRRDGRYLENLGVYDPSVKKAEEKVKLNLERYNHWVKQGALPSDSLARILKHAGQIKK
jgi:small subunit ribosomal protein S16